MIAPSATHLLDTSVYSQFLKPRPLESVMRRWMTIGDQHLAISAICHAELMAGIRQRKSAKLQAAYEKTLRGRIPILAVDQRVAEFFAEIKSEVRKVGGPREDFDLLIAATAKAHGLILATLNHRHFFDIQGLAVEDWSS